jgi:hypothetical protein
LEIVGGVVVEGEGAEEGVVAIHLATIEIDIKLKRLGGGASKGGGAG